MRQQLGRERRTLLTMAKTVSSKDNNVEDDTSVTVEPCTVHVQVSFNTHQYTELQSDWTDVTSSSHAHSAPYLEHNNGIISRRHVLQVNHNVILLTF